MSVSPVGGSSQAISTASSPDNATLSMEDFFSIWAAELQNQTMYNTVDNAEYMGQLAQYSVLSEMKELSQSCKTSYAISLLGKNVNVTGIDANGVLGTVSGCVEQVSIESGNAFVVVGGVSYDPTDIVSVING